MNEIKIPVPQVSAGTLTTAGTVLGVLGTLAYAAWGYFHGSMDPNTALGFALGAGGLGALHLHVSSKTAGLMEQALASAAADQQATQVQTQVLVAAAAPAPVALTPGAP